MSEGEAAPATKVPTIPDQTKTSSVASPEKRKNSQKHLPFPVNTFLPFEDDDGNDGNLERISINPELSDAQKQALRKTFVKHRRLFRREWGLLNDGSKMVIRPKEGSTPVHHQPYRHSPREKAVIDEVLDEMVAQGRVERSSSAWASPIFVVNSHGKSRMVIDIRGLNAAVERDSYPLPRVDEVLDELRGAKFISTFDLTKGFYQIPIDEKSRQYTAFTSHRGLEQLTVAAMGYRNSPAFFQRKMNEILLPWRRYARAYMDDFIIHTDSFDRHVEVLDGVLTALENLGLTLAANKSHAGFQDTTVLGHRVGLLGLATEESKVEGMLNLPVPTTVRQLASCLGLFGFYRSFIANFSQIAKPLYDIGNKITGDYRLVFKRKWPKSESSKNSKESTPAIAYERVREFKIEWTQAADIAFNLLKQRLKDAATLVPFDPELPQILYTDASYAGYGLALHQVVTSETGKLIERPVIFKSRGLRAPETKYWPTELEAGCVVWAKHTLHAYLDGAKDVTLVTDHAALQWIFNPNRSSPGRGNSRLHHWACYLDSWSDLKVKHRPGIAHANVDTLSRLPVADRLPKIIAEAQNTKATPILDEVRAYIDFDDGGDWSGHYLSDGSTARLYEMLSSQEDSPTPPEYHAFRFDPESKRLYMVSREQSRLVVPASKLPAIIQATHEENGHFGVEKTFHRLAAHISHQKLYALVKKTVAACTSCSHNATLRHRPYGALQPVESPAIPFHTIAIDWVTGLPRSNDYDSFLTITDKFTKVLRIIPCNKNDNAPKVAKILYDQVVRFFGLPRQIVSDRDSRLTSRYFSEVCRLLNIRRSLTTAYHAQADGQSERSNQTVEIAIRHYVDAAGLNWERHVGAIELAYNTSVNASTGFAPYELLYGRNPATGLDDIVPDEIANSRVPSTAEFLEARRIKHEAATDAIRWAQTRMAGYYDANHQLREYAVGDRVLLRAKDFPAFGVHQKIGPQRVGPFRITERIGKLAYKLDLPANIRIHPVINVAKLERASREGLYDAPIPVLSDGQQLYILSNIIDARERNGEREFLATWRNMPDYEATWERERDLRAAGNGPSITRFLRARERGGGARRGRSRATPTS